MTITQKRWTYAGVISGLLLIGSILPGGNRDSDLRTFAAVSAVGVAGLAVFAES